MKTSDIPFLREPTMTAPKTAAEKAEAERTAAAEKSAADRAAARADKTADAKADRPRRGDLQSAGQSGDPVVQKLLAERQAHEMNANEDADPALVEQRKVANEAIAAIDEKLADLGYSAK